MFSCRFCPRNLKISFAIFCINYNSIRLFLNYTWNSSKIQVPHPAPFCSQFCLNRIWLELEVIEEVGNLRDLQVVQVAILRILVSMPRAYVLCIRLVGFLINFPRNYTFGGISPFLYVTLIALIIRWTGPYSFNVSVRVTQFYFHWPHNFPAAVQSK